MKKVGILYICTGDYNLFWEDFYKSFQEKFLNNCELHYYVFTDAEKIYDEENNPNIHRKSLVNLPWPLITHFRFRTFLSIEEELKEMDYLMFSNANMICSDVVTEEEFLPREDKGEKLFVTVHPGYANMKCRHVPYDRNKKSYACIPYNQGKVYVIGAMNGGTSAAFLEMARTLNKAIEEDLKKNVIARWHDESHLNRYIVDRDDYRLLNSEYCYPYGMNVAYKRKISAVSKMEKFDVNKFKGVYKKTKKETTVNKLAIAKQWIKEDILFVRDKLLFKKVKKYGFK